MRQSFEGFYLKSFIKFLTIISLLKKHNPRSMDVTLNNNGSNGISGTLES